MVNLTLIQDLVDQVVGSLVGLREAPPLSLGGSEQLARCIDTLNFILEEISNDNAQTRRPTFVAARTPKADNVGKPTLRTPARDSGGTGPDGPNPRAYGGFTRRDSNTD